MALDEAQALEAIFAGGHLSPARRTAIRPALFAACPRCGRCPADSVHKLWTCPSLADHPSLAAAKTQDEAVLVERESHLACLYLRGILSNAFIQARGSAPVRAHAYLVDAPAGDA